MLSGQESVSFIYKYALKEKNIMSLTSINVNNTLVTSVDSEPTAGSENLVKSDGIYKEIGQLGLHLCNNKASVVKVQGVVNVNGV